METLLAGASIGGYRIESVVHEGVRITVYRAQQAELDRTVALHVAAAEPGSPDAEAFLARARALAALDHPHLARVFEARVADGAAFAAVAHLTGEPLQAAVHERRLSARSAAEVVTQLASAVEAVERIGVGHPDLSPERVSLAGDVTAPHAYVDGLRTAEGGAASPETAAGELGQLLATMVTGREAIDSVGAPDVPKPLRRVVDRALRPTQGYPSVTALAEAVRDAVEEDRRPRIRHGFVVATAALALALVVAVVVLVASRDERSTAPRTASSTAPAARIAATIPLGGKVGAVGFGEGAVWANVAPGKLLRIDPRTAKVVGTPIELGKRFDPTAIVAGAGSVWSNVEGTLVRIDARTGRITGRLPLGPGILGMTFAGGQLWVGVSSPPHIRPPVNELVRVDPRSMRRIGRPISVGHHPSDIDVSGTTAFTTNADVGTVTRVDTKTGATKTIRVSAQTSFSTLHDGVLWTTSSIDGTLSAIDAESLRLDDHVVRADRPYGVAALAGALWVTAFTGDPQAGGGESRLYRIDPATRRIAGRALDLGPDEGVPIAGGDSLWIGSTSRRALLKILPTSPPPQLRPAAPRERSPRRLAPGPLAPGEWVAPDFEPPVRFTLAERGWLTSIAPGLIGLSRTDRPDLFFTVAAPRRLLTGSNRLRPATSPRAALRILDANERLEIGRRVRVDVGGYAATRVAVRVPPGRNVPAVCGSAPCAPLFPFAGGTYILASNTQNRLYLLDGGTRLVLVSVEVPKGSPHSDFERAEAVVRSLRIGGT